MSESEYEKAKRELHEAAKRYRQSIPDTRDHSQELGENSCSFCGKDESQVEVLIAGPGVFICNECIEICNEIISVGNKSKTP